MKTLYSAVIVVVFFTGAAFADVSIYLYPRVGQKPGGLVLSDIAEIDADTDTVAAISEIGIDARLALDGYLDRREIIHVLADRVRGRVNVYGSGVRVADPGGESATGSSRIMVKKGETVRFQVVNACVKVEIIGTAMKDGAAGDVIPVKLRGSTVTSGKILNEKIVELEL